MGRPLSLLALGRLECRIAELVGVAVDPVPDSALRPELRAKVLAERSRCEALTPPSAPRGARPHRARRARAALRRRLVADVGHAEPDCPGYLLVSADIVHQTIRDDVPGIIATISTELEAE
jgi:hypothetical protein